MAKSTNYRGIHISVIYEYGYDYYEIREINKGKKWNDATLFSTLKEAKQYIDDHYDELVKLCNVKESKSYARKSLKEAKNGYYIYTKLDNKYAYCDKSKFTEEEGFYLIEDYMLDAIHIFKTEKEAEKFIDEDLNRFIVKKDNVVIDEYPSTKGGFFESKKSARKSIEESLNFKKDYVVEVMGGTYWFKPFYWDFDEFRNDLLIASKEEGFTYYITEESTTSYRINLESNDGFYNRYDITFEIIPKSNKATAKELNNYLN